MNDFLGETLVTDLSSTPYKNHTPAIWALEWIALYGGIDGAHHKDWVLDQVAQILNGTPVILKLAKWKNGTEEYRFSLGEPSPNYLQWVDHITDGVPENYEVGIAP